MKRSKRFGVEHPVIAAIRGEDGIDRLDESLVTHCFLLCGDINTLPGLVQRVRAKGKRVFLHLDLAKGFGNDRAALAYIKRELEPDGVVSTRTHLLKNAREEGLTAVQRLFIPDSMSVETGRHLLKQSKADAVEVMPGVVPAWVYQTLRRDIQIPIVAGGLLHQPDDVRRALEAGADAVSVSNQALWNQDF
ncbi:glycerol-3-phosphate responsive antiterminator [Desmospora profundinema]|uniref:Glycerol uptake operon antiterminator regulatory protein n=1 Tax=Desmospora profundinema TaxID=1571184 RepID=A0ABU1ITH0_9BACL|nr:glycerol-3-phosphate responsive antiterminator [Desmospora profundinema]MDR6227219.1 glycerol uptake operon antiterminator [Desmospora profundinema]